MKNRIFSLFFISALALGLLSCAYLQTQQRQLAGKLIRLHVVANSDSPSDQTLKLQVRDAVLAAAEPVLREADDPEQWGIAVLGPHTDVAERENIPPKTMLDRTHGKEAAK